MRQAALSRLFHARSLSSLFQSEGEATWLQKTHCLAIP